MQEQNITVKGNRVYDGIAIIGTFGTEARAWAYHSMLTEKRSDPRSEYWGDVRDMAQSISDEIDEQVENGITGEDCGEKAECQDGEVWLCKSCKDTRIEDAKEDDAEGETL